MASGNKLCVVRRYLQNKMAICIIVLLYVLTVSIIGKLNRETFDIKPIISLHADVGFRCWISSPLLN